MYETHGNGNKAVPGALADPWEPIAHGRLPYQPKYKGRCLVSTA